MGCEPRGGRGGREGGRHSGSRGGCVLTWGSFMDRDAGPQSLHRGLLLDPFKARPPLPPPLTLRGLVFACCTERPP